MNVEDLDDRRFFELASQIDGDQHIDWDVAEQTACDESERAVVSELRVVASVTGVLRGSGDRTTEGSRDTLSDPLLAENPRTWGPLTILQRIGHGAFGTVYRARDSLGREVALKLSTPGPQHDSAPEAKILQEARLLAGVRHANIVVVHGADRFDGRLGLWMELIRGRTLEDELQVRGRFSAQEARLIGLDLCRALAAVHDAGLVHRDVKARNVMRESGGRIVLMDFGAGALASVGKPMATDVAGTPLYLPPEIFAGQPASRASDVYSLGVLLYHLVSDDYPVSGVDRSEIQRAHQDGRRKRLRDVRPDLPEGFVHAVESSLAPDPQRRYQTAGEFEHALMTWATHVPPTPVPASFPTRPWLAIAALALAAVSGAIVWWMLRQPPRPDDVAARTTSAAAAEPHAPHATVPVDSYTLSAVLYKVSKSETVPLAAGDRVIPGDALALKIQASKPVYVYVVNEDERGEAYLLFPLQGQESMNPLAPDRLHELPGRYAGGETQWQVTSAGGREHFVLFVSPTHMAMFDELLQSLPQPVARAPISRPPVPRGTIDRLRGVGGLAPREQPSTRTSPRHLFALANPLGAQPETVQGVCVRQIWLENPTERP